MPTPYNEAAARFLSATVLRNEYIPHKPAQKQAQFCLSLAPELLYGGAAGGGKSDALLMAALQFVSVPGYAALLLRRSYRDLALPGAIMDRAAEWLRNTKARWLPLEYRWVFPSGASLTFGYLQNDNDKYRYQSAEFQYVGFDETTQFELPQYLYLFSRLRRGVGMTVPLRMRCASNPGGVGHAWVKERFITPKRFIPATLADNPFIDQESYIASLNRLDMITRAQLLNGDWDVSPEGALFRREWFQIVDDYPHVPGVRYWDLAATPEKAGKDPDYTSGCHMIAKDGQVWITDMVHERVSPLNVERLVRQKAEGDQDTVWMEQEPGSSGVNTIDHYRRTVLAGFDFRPDRKTGSKIERARPLSASAEAGNVFLVRGAWNEPFLDELTAFPQGDHDDQVDAASGAFAHVFRRFLCA